MKKRMKKRECGVIKFLICCCYINLMFWLKKYSMLSKLFIQSLSPILCLLLGLIFKALGIYCLEKCIPFWFVHYKLDTIGILWGNFRNFSDSEIKIKENIYSAFQQHQVGKIFVDFSLVDLITKKKPWLSGWFSTHIETINQNDWLLLVLLVTMKRWKNASLINFVTCLKFFHFLLTLRK